MEEMAYLTMSERIMILTSKLLQNVLKEIENDHEVMSYIPTL